MTAMHATTTNIHIGTGGLLAVRPVAGSRRRRVIEAVGFVALWVAAGYVLGLSSNAYLLLGIPLTAAFQLLVRRRPLRELFAAGTSRFRLTAKGAALAVVLAATPAYYAVRAVGEGDWATIGWYGAAMGGAVAAAFSLRATSIATSCVTRRDRSPSEPVALPPCTAHCILRPGPRFLPRLPWGRW
jgi:hypothetical protein